MNIRSFVWLEIHCNIARFGFKLGFQLPMSEQSRNHTNDYFFMFQTFQLLKCSGICLSCSVLIFFILKAINDSIIERVLFQFLDRQEDRNLMLVSPCHIKASWSYQAHSPITWEVKSLKQPLNASKWFHMHVSLGRKWSFVQCKIVNPIPIWMG